MVIVEMKRHFRERAIEWWSASMLTLWGAYALLTPGMFEKSVSYSGLLLLAPQYVWGFIAFTVGMVRLAALTVNGFWHRTPLIRLVTSVVGVAAWFWITVGIYLSDIAQMGLVVYAWLVTADIYSVFRSAADTYEAEAQRRLKQLSNPHLMENASNVRSISGN